MYAIDFLLKLRLGLVIHLKLGLVLLLTYHQPDIVTKVSLFFVATL